MNTTLSDVDLYKEETYCSFTAHNSIESNDVRVSELSHDGRFLEKFHYISFLTVRFECFDSHFKNGA